MAIYMPGKFTQIAQRYLWLAQSRFQRITHECETLVLIGVRPWETDTHLWPAIFQTNAKVLFIGGESDFHMLIDCRGKKRTSLMISEQFEGAIESLVKEM